MSFQTLNVSNLIFIRFWILPYIQAMLEDKLSKYWKFKLFTIFLEFGLLKSQLCRVQMSAEIDKAEVSDVESVLK